MQGHARYQRGFRSGSGLHRVARVKLQGDSSCTKHDIFQSLYAPYQRRSPPALRPWLRKLKISPQHRNAYRTVVSRDEPTSSWLHFGNISSTYDVHYPSILHPRPSLSRIERAQAERVPVSMSAYRASGPQRDWHAGSACPSQARSLICDTWRAGVFASNLTPGATQRFL